MIPFNKPYLSGKELHYIKESVESGKISGDGIFTKKCHAFFETTYGFKKALLTTSCTDALEMIALLLDIQPGDEVIAPSYTFVSTVNAFALRGAKLVFADSRKEEPNLDASQLEALITPKTKAIVPVHYAGVACDMDAIQQMASSKGIHVVEDAAQAIASYYKGKALGSIGSLAAFSFHETKNIISGEGGMLAINDEQYSDRAEIIREKGTNRSAFFRGQVDKYNWVDVGSSFLPSDLIAAFLFAQTEQLTSIQEKRIHIWNRYQQRLKPLSDKGYFDLPVIPSYATNNAHMFYLVCRSLEERTALIDALRKKDVLAVFHYQALHRSPFAQKSGQPLPHLPNCDHFTDCLVRLPLYYELSDDQTDYICDAIQSHFQS
jgi:dTDP-4-amino-4,6-dideoxygalactose transaminase